MNSFNLILEEIINSEARIMDGIRFSGISFVRVLIDFEYIEEIDGFRDSLIVFDELEKSSEASGNYLIFTCACGVAEDGGWEGVAVKVVDNSVEWLIDFGAVQYKWRFDKIQYDSEIRVIKNAIKLCALPLEPVAVVFPENFKR